MLDPPGAPASGYDTVFREPIVYDVGDTRVESRREFEPIRIPCQMEDLSEDRLHQVFQGDAPSSTMILVFHRSDLARLGLIVPATRETLIRTNDRVSVIERLGEPGAIVRSLGPGGAGLFIYELRAASWGFGPDGYDLELAYLNDRPRAV